MGKIFLYSGEEEFLKREELERLRNTHGEKTVIFNFSPRDRDFDLKDILRLARTKNLFSPYQIILIKDIEKLSSLDSEALIYYIRNPSKFTDLILITKLKIKKISSENLWLNNLIKEPNVKIKEFLPLSGEELQKWIIRQVNKYGKGITPSAINFLVTKLGNDLSNLYQAIEKACFYVKDKKTIEWIDLEPIIGKEISSDIYEMLDALLNKELSRSINILRNMQDLKERPERIIGVLAGEFRKFLIAKRFLQKGFNENEIKKELSLYYSEKFFYNLRKITLEKIKKSLNRLLFVDYAIKTGKLEPFFAIESWFLEMFS